MALVSLALPIIGVAMGLYGAFRAFAGSVTGWLWLVGGVFVLIVDLIIDERWSYWTRSSEPDLNKRGEQLVGQVVTVAEAIPPGGRGVVRAADTVWPAEGVEAAAGAKVRITGCKGTVLTVEAV
jgi:membrane protein implicated in regulation of membrane protease activity